MSFARAICCGGRSARQMPLGLVHRRQQNTRCARGFTLLELMLVLAVIVAVMAVVAPAVFGPLENYRLQKAGELVRSRWAKARSEAMRTGMTYMFRFQPGQPTYEIQPWFSEQDLVESSFVGMDASTGVSSGLMPAVPLNNPGANATPFFGTDQASWHIEEQLPDGTLFVGFDVVTSTRDVSITEQLHAAGAMADGWSTPILFYPDGTTSTARLVVGNQQGVFMVIRLRGISGVAELSDLLSRDELALE